MKDYGTGSSTCPNRTRLGKFRLDMRKKHNHMLFMNICFITNKKLDCEFSMNLVCLRVQDGILLFIPDSYCYKAYLYGKASY